MKTESNQLEVADKDSLLPIIMVGDRCILLRDKPSEYFDKGGKMTKPIGYAEPYATGDIKAIGPGFVGYPVPKFNENGEEKPLRVGLKVNYWHQHAIPMKFAIDGGEEKEYDCIRSSDIFAVT